MFKKGLVVCALAAVMTMGMTAAAFAGSSDAFSVYPVNGGSGYDNIDGEEGRVEEVFQRKVGLSVSERDLGGELVLPGL